MGCILYTESGASCEKNYELQPEIFIPSIYISPDGRNNVVPIFDGFMMDIQWRFTYQKTEYRIPIESLMLSSSEPRFAQNGNDSDGLFAIEGKFDVAGRVRIELVHTKAENTKIFVGQFKEGNIISGIWKNNKNEQGDFKIDLLGNIYKAENLWFLVKENSSEPCGLANFKDGICTFITQKVLDKGKINRFDLKLKFANGIKGSFDAQIYQEGIAGEIQTEKGIKENLTLTIKNEFE